MECVVSIVVSIYNIEKYIIKCLDSLVNQSVQGYELILVDDGSSDGCPVVLDECAKRFSFIKVIHKPNGGLSSARNAGMQVASGEYVIFVDGDDWVSPKFVEYFVSGICKYHPDVLVCRYSRVLENGDVDANDSEDFNSISLTGYLDDPRLCMNYFNKMFGGLPKDRLDVVINMCVWRCAYKRKLLVENGISFKSEREFISEDILFQLDIMRCVKTIFLIDAPLYFYRCNSQSLTGKYREDRFEKELYLWAHVSPILESLQGEALLRGKRLFLGKVRNAIRAEVEQSNKSYADTLKAIKRMINHDDVSQLIQDYPIWKLKLSLFLFTLCVKYKMAFPIYILCRIKMTNE